MVRLVDAHMHLWDLSRHYYGWLQDDPLPNNPAGDMTPIARRNYLVADYLMDTSAAEIAGAVHVECGLPLDKQLSETDWLNELADETGLPSAIVAGAVLEHPDADAHLAAQVARARVRGVRQIINWHADKAKTYSSRDMLDDADWQRGFGLLAKHGLSFDMQLYPGQMGKAAQLAARHPDTAIIINHAGMPTDRDEASLKIWRAGLTRLAMRPNVSIKVSGLAMVDRAWTAESLAPFICFVIDTFGSDRAMFGSNFPVEKVHGAFKAHLDAFLAAIADYSEADRAALLEGTARRVYRI